MFSWRTEIPTDTTPAVFSESTFSNRFSSLLPLKSFFVAIMNVQLNCKRYPELITRHNRFEPAQATKPAADAVIAGENLIRNAGHGVGETLCSSAPRNFRLLLLSKALLEFKYSLFKQFHWETLQRHSASLPGPSPHPSLLQTVDLVRAWRHPWLSGLLRFVQAVLLH